MSQQETSTDRLVSIIQKTQLGRGTGQLIARRGIEATYEEGTIIFVNGKVTEARVGRRVGADALNWLSTWGNSLYVFIPSISSSTIPERSLPPSRSSYYSDTDTSVYADAQPQLAAPPLQGQPNTYEARQENIGELHPTPPAGSSTNTNAPYPVRQLDSALRVIEQLGLSRTHRRLFLLINGHRSLPELMRLMGRTYDEVYELLVALEHATVIRMPERLM